MTDYFAANDLAAFIATSGVPTETTTAGRFDPLYCTKAIANGTAKSPQFMDPATGAAVSLTDAWVHVSLETLSPSTGGIFLSLINAAGTPIVRLVESTGSGIRIDYWNGAAWVAGSAYTNTDNTLSDIDIHFVGGAAGSLDLYRNNSLIKSVTPLAAACDNIAFYETGSSGQQSQILVSDQSTIGAKVSSLTPNSNSATNTAWAGDYTSLNKVGYNDTTLVSSSTLGDKESYGATDVTLPTANYFVSSVWLALRARLNSAAPQNIKPLLRIGGVDYNGGYNIPGLNAVSFAPGVAAFPVDPSTGVAWAGVTNLNAAEVGFITQT